jgi:hypothetical protein
MRGLLQRCDGGKEYCDVRGSDALPLGFFAKTNVMHENENENP